jgi:hypothetical protein
MKAIERAAAIAILGGMCLFATTLPPCTAGAAGENIIPVLSGMTTYCVSDFGWSDTWLMGSPTAYNQGLDLFSGDDAFNLYYNSPTNGVGAGAGWLSPSLDAGTGAPTSVPSKYSVVTPVHSTGANSAESVIQNPDGLQITIDTYAIGMGVQETLSITNVSSSTITGLALADYFNFHPNGSLPADLQLGTTSIQNGCVQTVGLMSATTFLTNGFMCGVTAPTAYEVGFADGSDPVWLDVQNLSYLDNTGPVGPGNTAGALEWDLGSVAPGATVMFAVGKNLDPVLPPVPEPSSVALMIAGGLLLIVRRSAAGRIAQDRDR